MFRFISLFPALKPTRKRLIRKLRRLINQRNVQEWDFSAWGLDKGHRGAILISILQKKSKT